MEDSRGRFWGLLKGTASPSDADESEPNKSSACLGFLPASLTLAREVFSVALSSDDLAANFMLHFKGLAKASSWAEVCVPKWINFPPHPHLPEAFLATGAIIVAEDFTLRLRTTGLGRG
jgi:hypothetical protein